jgi:hypothetical protein
MGDPCWHQTHNQQSRITNTNVLRVPADVSPQRPVAALTTGAVLAVRPRSAVRVAPRLASVLVDLDLTDPTRR